MAMNMGTLADHYYSLGQDTHRTKQSSFAGLGSAGMAASRLSPVGLRGIGTTLAYEIPGAVAGGIGGSLVGAPYGGALLGSTLGKVLKDLSSMRIADRLTASEARQVLGAIPYYKTELAASSTLPLMASIGAPALGSENVYAVSNLVSDLLVRRSLMQRARMV